MNISELQFKLKKMEIVKKLIKKGITPTSAKVNQYLKEFYRDRCLGAPYFTPIKDKPHDISNSKTYNYMFSSLGEDLNVLFKAKPENSLNEYYLNESTVVKKATEKTILEFYNLQDSIKLNKSCDSFSQVFDSFYNIDFVGDIKRNIPSTNAFVDLIKGTVQIDNFETENIYVSKPIDFNFLVDTLIFQPTDSSLPNTELHYYIGIDNNTTPVDWQEIIPSVPFNTGNLNSVSTLLNKDSLDFSEEIASNRVVLYKLCGIKDNLNLNSIKLTLGNEMWRLDEIDLNKENYLLSISDYDKNKISTTSYLDDAALDITIKKGVYYVMTKEIYCDKDLKLENVVLELTDTNNKIYLQTMILLNNTELKTRDLLLKKGKNTLQILIYLSMDYCSESAGIKHNLNFKEYSLKTYAEPPMKRVSYYDLLNKNYTKNQNYFSVDENNNIVVSIDPKKYSGIKYTLNYKVIDTNKLNKLNLKDEGIYLSFRVKASLKSSDKSVSPKILNYRIIGV